MKQSPHYVTQVEELCVEDFTYSYINKRTYVNIFPNARVFIVEWYGEHNQLEFHSPYSEQIEVYNPTSKVKILHDSAYCELASQMLVANLCSGLKELKLNFVYPFVENHLDVIGQFNNLPALSILTLQSCMIGLFSLEHIHENASNIRELKMDDIHIIDCEIPSLIIPAHSVTSISIKIIGVFPEEIDDDQDIDLFELYGRFYQYMSRKYLKLIHVKHLNTQLLYSSPDRRRRVFLYGLLDFYRSILCSTTTKLNIQALPNDINIFDVCNDNNCQIAELEARRCDKDMFFQHLTNSNQRNYIIKLNLHDTEIDPSSFLIYLKTLQFLQLFFSWSYESPAIDLTDYLNGCPPSLKYFSIDFYHLEADPSNTLLSCIETLVITCRDPGRDIFQVISSSLPYLVELKLTSIMCIQKNMKLELHSPTLEKATFSYPQHPKRGYGFAFKSLEDTQFQYYLITNTGKAGTTREELQGVNTLTVSTLKKKRVFTSHEITLFSM